MAGSIQKGGTARSGEKEVRVKWQETWEPFLRHVSCESPRVRDMISTASRIKYYRKLKWECQLSH